MIFQLHEESGYDTRPLSGLTALIGVPVVLDIGAQFTPQLVDIIYAPVGVAAFAVGVLFVFERRFLAVQRTAYEDQLSIYLDERGLIRDYSTAAVEALPELEGAIGDHLEAVVPSVAAAVDSDTQILVRDHADERRYYFVSATTVTLGEAGAQVVRQFRLRLPYRPRGSVHVRLPVRGGVPRLLAVGAQGSADPGPLTPTKRRQNGQ